MQGNEKTYRELFEELSEYEQYGIPMRIDGESASPMQIASAHMVKEKCAYMRDYVLDEKGQIEELCFHEVKNFK